MTQHSINPPAFHHAHQARNNVVHCPTAESTSNKIPYDKNTAQIKPWSMFHYSTEFEDSRQKKARRNQENEMHMSSNKKDALLLHERVRAISRVLVCRRIIINTVRSQST